MAPEAKTCTGCQQALNLSQFGIKDPKTGRQLSRCRACVRAYGKRHYADNTQVYVEKASIRNDRIVCENRDRISRYLSKCVCVACGATHDLHPHVPHLPHVPHARQILDHAPMVLKPSESEVQTPDLLSDNGSSNAPTHVQPPWMIISGSAESLMRSLRASEILCSGCLRTRLGSAWTEWQGLTRQERAAKKQERVEQAIDKPKGFHQSHRPSALDPREHLAREQAKVSGKQAIKARTSEKRQKDDREHNQRIGNFWRLQLSADAG